MAFATQLDADEDIVIADNTLVIGTAVLGDDFGQVKSASVKRTSDKEEIKAAGGNLRAVLLSNARFELTLECLFDTTVTPPGLGDVIDLPFTGVTGIVLDATIKWEEGKERMLSISATSWDALEGAATYTLNTTTGTFTAL